MVKVAPEDPSSLTDTCLVSALFLGEQLLLLGGRGLLGLGRTGAGWLCYFRGLEGEPERRHGLLSVPLDGEDALAPWHLHEVVGRVSRRHELSESRVPEDGVVRETDAGDVEVHQLGAVVVARVEGDKEANLP